MNEAIETIVLRGAISPSATAIRSHGEGGYRVVFEFPRSEMDQVHMLDAVALLRQLRITVEVMDD